MYTLVGFEENEYGCAVQKIFPNGNALNSSRGDKLEVGDHLASINGASAFQKNVTEVCKALAASKSSDDIHLVFIRYIGPIRNSNAIEQQGYEVIDPQVEKAKAKAEEQRQRKENNMSPVKLSRSLSRLGAKKPQNPDPPKETSPPAKETTSQPATIKNETIIEVVKDDSKKKRIV